MKKFICFVLSIMMISSMFFTTIDAVVVGLKSNTNYYIMNTYTENYISLYSSSTSSSLGVVGRSRDSNVNLSKWQMVFNTDGTVLIVDAQNRALSVNSSNEVYVSTNTNASNQQFTITRVDNSGSYRGTYFIKYGSLYLHYVSDSSIKLLSTVGTNSRWSIYESEKGSSYLYNYYVMETNSNGDQEILATDLSSSYYNSAITSLGYTHSELKNKSASTIYSRMRTNIDLLCIATHGVQGDAEAGLSMLSCNNGTSTTEGEYSYLSAGTSIPQTLGLSPYYAINSLSSNVMASCRCVFLIGCATGDSFTHNGTTYSLLESLYNKGVHCAVGTSETISGGDIGLFNYYMQQLLVSEYHSGDIGGILESINEKYLSQNFYQQEFPFVVYGDVYQYIKFN